MPRKKYDKEIVRKYFRCPKCGARIIAAKDNLVRIEYVCPKCNMIYEEEKSSTGN